VFKDLDHIKTAARETGSHFFSPSTMRFFSSRIHGALYGGRFFVTSERDSTGSAWGGERRYSVRVARFLPNKERLDIDTVGDHGAYDTAREAHAAAQRLAGLVEVCRVCKSLAVDCLPDCGGYVPVSDVCSTCGVLVIPGEHSGHRAHFTGAWCCHDCGAYCEGGE